MKINKTIHKTIILTTATLALAFSVNAHDPSLHAKKAPAKADCSSYNKMVASGKKMDMTDPVMLAMMKKCKDQKAQSEHDNADGHHDEEAQSGHNKADGHQDKKAEMKCGNMDKTEMKCGNMAASDTMKTGEGKCEGKNGHHNTDKSKSDKCGNKNVSDHKQKTEMKCGGDMMKASNKVEDKAEEHDH